MGRCMDMVYFLPVGWLICVCATEIGYWALGLSWGLLNSCKLGVESSTAKTSVPLAVAFERRQVSRYGTRVAVAVQIPLAELHLRRNLP
ncbi:hypothetical protein BDZ89DRAFT_1059514 [Hymenopellis radicata]|nr:hypothetical protein BDZ89DRAFT_1059514 [Hymenopellis radicata]